MSRTPVKGPLVIPNTLMVKLEWGTPGATGEVEFSNVTFATYTSVPPNLTTLAESLFTSFKAGLASSNWATFVSTAYAFKRVQVKDINVKNLPWHISSGAEVAGSGAGAALPAQAAVVVTSLTQFSGREWHGRSYLGGLDAGAQIDARHHGPAAGQAGVDFLGTIKSSFQTNSLTMALAQRALNADLTDPNNSIPARTAHAEPITGFKIVNNRLDTQRRRLGR